MSSVSLFDIISVIVLIPDAPNSKIFVWIHASAAEAVVVNPNVINTLLTNGWSAFFVYDKPAFSNSPSSLPRNAPDYISLDSSVFEHFMLTEDLFAKALQKPMICLSVNKNLWGKLVSSSPKIFDDNPRVTSLYFLSFVSIHSAVKLITLRLPCFINSFCINAEINSQNLYIIFSGFPGEI